MKTIVLFDTNWHGHHPSYLKVYTKVLIEEGYKIWLCCQRPTEIKKRLKGILQDEKIEKNLVEYKVYPTKPWRHFPLFFSSIRRWVYAAKCIKDLIRREKCQPDIVFFLKIDTYKLKYFSGQLMDILFPYKWIGLFIHLLITSETMTGEKTRKQNVKYDFSFIKAQNCKAVCTLQENFVEKLKSLIGEKIFLFPDVTSETFICETDMSRDILRKARGRKIISLLGGQDKRKGLFDLFEVARRSRDKNWFFLFAGKMNLPEADRDVEKLKAQISSGETENCYFHFDFVEDGNEFNSLVKVSDAIFAVYKDFSFYSSAILTKAALFHKPVLVNSNSLLARRVKNFRTGTFCEAGDIDQIMCGIERLAKKEFLKNPRYDEYFQEHSQDRLRTLFKQILTNL